MKSWRRTTRPWSCRPVPGKPKDKAQVESAVLVAQRWILARLRDHTFFTLAALNEAIWALLVDLNDRPMQQLGVSRRTRYEQLDRPALRPLPTSRYDRAAWKPCRVNIDYHIQVDHHLYSVPYQLIHELVEARSTTTTVEIYVKDRRLTSHPRRYDGQPSTKPEHMPHAHRAHAEWTPSRLIHWAEQTGPATGRFVAELLRRRPHPEQGYRACLGIMRLGRRYGADRLEAASVPRGRPGVVCVSHDHEHPPVGAGPAPARGAGGTVHHATARQYPRRDLLHPIQGGRMLIEQTLEKLTTMKLGAMAEAVQQQLRSDEATALSFEDRLGVLVDTEWTAREQRKLTRRLRAAKLRYPASLEAVDFTHPRRLKRQQVVSLGSCAWIADRHNLLITGPTGIGKSFLVSAFVERACRRGFAARYVRMPRLLHEVAVGRGDGSYTRLLTRLAKLDLLAIDDWLLAPLRDAERRDLAEVIEDRAERASTLIASQLPVPDWHAVIGDPNQADAICDRLLHDAHRIELTGPSLRRTKTAPKTSTKAQT